MFTTLFFQTVNLIGDNGVNALCEMLLINTTLTTLMMESEGFSINAYKQTRFISFCVETNIQVTLLGLPAR